MQNDKVEPTGSDWDQLPLFCGLHPETRAALAAMRRLVRYSAGETVVHETEAGEFVGLLSSGVLRMQKTLIDGRHPIVGLLVEGDLFGRIFDGPSEFAVEAATDAEVIVFPRGPFEALLKRSPDLDRVVLLNTLDELDRARDWMIILSNQKVINRVAGFLVLMCTRFAQVNHLLVRHRDGLEVTLPISRLDLASLLGTRAESISRALHALARTGEIEILAPDHILVRDAAALAARAGEEDLATTPSLKALMRDPDPSNHA